MDRGADARGRDDTLWGGLGADTFAFAVGDGHDTVVNFEDGDTIEMAGVSGGFAGLVIEQDGADAVIRYGIGDTITVQGVSAESLDEADFSFSGGDTLKGGDGDDTLHGSGSGEEIQGGAGDDRLYGGKGNDYLNGGDGADRFVFDRESDADRIQYFEDGKDTLVIKGGLQFADLDIKQSGDDTVVSGPSDTFSIVIVDFDASLLTADDFDFIA